MLEIIGMNFYKLQVNIHVIFLFNFRNKESYWHKILSFCQTHKSTSADDHVYTKQLLYCLTILFLNCLYEYTMSLTPKVAPGQTRTSLLLIEAFTGRD